MMKVKYKIWLDDNGVIFGKGPYNLLIGVKNNGSLSVAAKSMGMSYNKAHNLIKKIEQRLGFKLLVSKSGGNRGGGSLITEEAEKLIKKYESFFSECDKCLENIFNNHFKDSNLSK